MSTFHTQIFVNNETDLTLTLNAGQSQGLGDGAWPGEIKPNSNVPPFTQDWSFQIKFTAVYESNDGSIGLVFYGDGVEVFDCAVEPNPSNAFHESSASNNGPMNVTFTIKGE